MTEGSNLVPSLGELQAWDYVHGHQFLHHQFGGIGDINGHDMRAVPAGLAVEPALLGLGDRQQPAEDADMHSEPVRH